MDNQRAFLCAESTEYALINGDNIPAVAFDIVGRKLQVFLMLLLNKTDDISGAHTGFQRGILYTESLAAFEIFFQAELQVLLIIAVIFQRARINGVVRVGKIVCYIMKNLSYRNTVTGRLPLGDYPYEKEITHRPCPIFNR